MFFCGFNKIFITDKEMKRYCLNVIFKQVVEDRATFTRKDRQRDKELLEDSGAKTSSPSQRGCQQRSISRRDQASLDPQVDSEDGRIFFLTEQ